MDPVLFEGSHDILGQRFFVTIRARSSGLNFALQDEWFKEYARELEWAELQELLATSPGLVAPGQEEALLARLLAMLRSEQLASCRRLPART